VEKQHLIISLLASGIVVVLVAAWFGIFDSVSRSFTEHENAMGGFAIVALLALVAFFHEDHFVLLLVITVLLYSVATLGLNIQFGYAGVLNFCWSFFFWRRRLYFGGIECEHGIAASPPCWWLVA